MTLGPIKVGGFSVGDTLTSSEMNTANTEIQQALDGAGGGSYTPSAALLIGGEGIAAVELADTTALKAVNTTSLGDGAYRWVTGLGRYRLDKTGAGASDTEDLPLVVAPTTGTGRWFAEDERACKQYKITVTATGNWTSPRNLAKILLDMWGGGGGGGDGSGASSAQGLTSHQCGGSGGGAGQRVMQVVDITPATSYTTHIGAGGAIQSDGGQTYFGASLVVANGGGAGQLGPSTSCLAPGGKRGGAGELGVPAGQTLTGPFWPVSIGDGGYVTTAGPQSAAGGYSELGVAGGSAGTKGTDSTNGGGLGGGGGGSGPGGVGGTGGNGGNGSNVAANSSNNGAAGGNAAANTGAGGGGGGGGGSAGSGTSTGGFGGTGGSGQIIIRGLGLATAPA